MNTSLPAASASTLTEYLEKNITLLRAEHCSLVECPALAIGPNMAVDNLHDYLIFALCSLEVSASLRAYESIQSFIRGESVDTDSNVAVNAGCSR